MSVNIDKVSVTWTEAVCVWWAFMWRVSLLSIPITVVVGITLGVIAYRVNAQTEIYSILSQVIAIGISIVASVVVFKALLSKSFKRFRVVIVRNEE